MCFSLKFPERSGKLRAMRKNPHAVALGRKGGRIGGKRRAENRTPEELSAIGKKGAAVRWGKVKGKDEQTTGARLPTP